MTDAVNIRLQLKLSKRTGKDLQEAMAQDIHQPRTRDEDRKSDGSNSF